MSKSRNVSCNMIASFTVLKSNMNNAVSTPVTRIGTFVKSINKKNVILPKPIRNVLNSIGYILNSPIIAVNIAITKIVLIR